MTAYTDLREQLLAVCRHWLSEDIANAYVELAKPAVGLRKVSSFTGSHFGGEPNLPSKSAWPSIDGSRLALLAMLDLSEIDMLEHGLGLPADGFLNVFFAHERRRELEEVDACEIGSMVYCSVADANPRAVPDGVKRFPRFGLEVIQLLSMPSYEDSVFDELMGVAGADLMAAENAIRLDQKGTRHQLGGWPTLLQESLPWSAEGKSPRFVLQLEYDASLDFRWLGGGILYFGARSLRDVSTTEQRASCCLQL